MNEKLWLYYLILSTLLCINSFLHNDHFRTNDKRNLLH